MIIHPNGVIVCDRCPYCLAPNYTCAQDCPAEKAREADRFKLLAKLYLSLPHD